LEDLMFVWLF